ncbi:putative dipeptidyl peptidase IV [Anopheles sinensis]|uniref:Putative dipeptidyl peptidase IV n=1 Tax=Anopheles sinensis TaxID=74873 RepID=A0A084VKQ1_ANOSI|nr:putative dipeptidyl peptidase IV [Anopheles sinensis]
MKRFGFFGEEERPRCPERSESHILKGSPSGVIVIDAYSVSSMCDGIVLALPARRSFSRSVASDFYSTLLLPKSKAKKLGRRVKDEKNTM